MCQCINRVVLIVVNVIFALIGAALIGVSLWVILSPNTLFQAVKVVTYNVNVDDATLNNYMNSTSMLTAAAWVLLAFGALSLLVGLCGCIGAAKESSCLLITYAVLVSIILIGEIAAAVVVAVFKTQVEAELKPRLQTLLQQHYLPLDLVTGAGNQNTSAVISGYINYMQVSLECCGISNYTDATSGSSRWSQSNPTFKNRTLVVPVSCCSMKSNRGDLLAKSDWSNSLSYLSDPECPYTGNNMLKETCYSKVNGYIDTFTLPIIIAAVVIALLEILFVVMACSLVQKVRSDDSRIV